MKPIVITGVVEEGSKRAQKVGYPTANFYLQTPSKELHGVWVGIAWRMNNSYTRSYAIGAITPNGRLAEVHWKDSGEAPKYGDIVSFELVKKVQDKPDILVKDMALLKTCEECRFCHLKDNGYSNWTVEGTDSTCHKGLRENHEDTYAKNPLDLVAVDCESFFKGEPWHEDVEGDEAPPNDHWAKLEAEFKGVPYREDGETAEGKWVDGYRVE